MIEKSIGFLFFVLTLTEAALPGCKTCPENGQWSPWKDFTSCSKTCGFFGKKIQKRTCTSWGFGCGCKGVYSRIVPCPGTRCPKAPFCAAGHTVLPKQCKPIARADDWIPSKCTWNAKLNRCPCPSGGIWSGWSNSLSTPCSASCGLCGIVTQTRSCISGVHGCPCTGPLSRRVTCPQAPCPQAPKCCHGQPAIKNLETNTTKCFQLPADPLLSPVPACLTTDCGKCTMTSPVFQIDTTTDNMTIPFSEDSLSQNAEGCVVRVMLCESDFVDAGSMVEFDYDSSKQTRNGKFDVEVVLTCNGTGDGWVFTPGTPPETDWGSNTTVVHEAQCFAATCANTGVC